MFSQKVKGLQNKFIISDVKQLLLTESIERGTFLRHVISMSNLASFSGWDSSWFSRKMALRRMLLIPNCLARLFHSSPNSSARWRKQSSDTAPPLLMVTATRWTAFDSVVTSTCSRIKEHDDAIAWKRLPQYWPVVREAIGPRWIPFTKGQ